MYHKPLAYFITFTTYGTWLHGDPRTSVVVQNHGTKVLEPQDSFYRYAQRHLKHPAVTLDPSMRHLVLRAMIERCGTMQWRLLACHVRSNHVHLLIASDEPIEKVLSSLKAWGTRQLRRAGYNLIKVWTHHGSTKYVFRKSKLLEKMHYIIHEQGDMMDYYLDPDYAMKRYDSDTECDR